MVHGDIDEIRAQKKASYIVSDASYKNVRCAEAVKNPRICPGELSTPETNGQLHSKWANGPVLPVPESLGRGHILQQERGDQLVC